MCWTYCTQEEACAKVLSGDFDVQLNNQGTEEWHSMGVFKGVVYTIYNTGYVWKTTPKQNYRYRLRQDMICKLDGCSI